jgi:hypothetical protein
VAGDGELIGEEVATEEVLMPKMRVVSSSLVRVLDVAVETTVLRGDLDGNRGGRWYLVVFKYWKFLYKWE